MGGHSIITNFYLKLLLINAYCRIPTFEKRLLWDTLTAYIQNSQEGKIMLGGDINVVFDLSKKKGRISHPQRTIMDLKNFISENVLYDVLLWKRHFTWTNIRRNLMQIIERMDRLLVT